MKYSNSLKYMESFVEAGETEASQMRLRTLCQKLGRIELGAKYICIPNGSAGYASAQMLSSVISEAGYNVGIITSSFDYDSRFSIIINGEIASIEDYNSSVAEVKSAVGRLGVEEYRKEEVVVALGLLLCKLSECEYVILQGLSENNMMLDAVCAPYELIVVPSIYDTEVTDEKIKNVCELIRRGSREVVNGNQKIEIYNHISNACASRGARLNIPLKAQFKVVETTAKRVSFTYGDRESFSMRSPSLLLQDCAMTVIEAALALRRGGVKLPWNSIAEGIAKANATGCFELLSISPLFVVDSASRLCEAEMLVETLKTVLGDIAVSELSLCLPKETEFLSAAFESIGVGEIITYSADGGDGVSCDSVKKCAKEALKLMKSGKNVICLGSVKFAFDLKSEIYKLMY